MRNGFIIKKLNIYALILTLVLLATLFCSCNYEQENKGRAINSVNHRGYFEAPENTLSAFRLSAEKGFTMVETDVSFTKDGVAVLLHDGSVDRTSNGSGRISNLTFEEISKLDFGSWKSDKYKNERIPLFTDFIALCKELNLYPYIEIKGGASIEQVESLAYTVEESEIAATWISRKNDYLLAVYNIRSKSKYGANDRYGRVLEIITQKDIDALAEIDKDSLFMDANYLSLTDTQIRLCKRNGVALEVWTLNDENLIKNVNPYISGVTSDKYNATEIFNNIK